MFLDTSMVKAECPEQDKHFFRKLPYFYHHSPEKILGMFCKKTATRGFIGLRSVISAIFWTDEGISKIFFEKIGEIELSFLSFQKNHAIIF